MAALELSGTPSLYFPVSMPQANGDQVMAPTPEENRRSGQLSSVLELQLNTSPVCPHHYQTLLNMSITKTWPQILWAVNKLSEPAGC